MGMSATDLGRTFGLTGQEMNAVLVELGFLAGAPGEYYPTPKGQPFITEVDHHRGTGGYSCYNRYWTTRTFDPAIKRELSITPELKEKVRSGIKAARAARLQEQAAAQAEADALFRAKLAREKLEKEAAAAAAERAAKNAAKLRKVGKIGLIVICVAGVAYGIYKLTPVVKRKIKERKEKKSAKNRE